VLWMWGGTQGELLPNGWAGAVHPPSVCCYGESNAGRRVWQLSSPGLKGAEMSLQP